MRPALRVRWDLGAQVAIYDALLFLMVVILVSEGMFLYTATIASEAGGFSEDHYQHLADTQRIMVEGLSLGPAQTSPLVRWTNATHNETLPLDDVLEGEPEARTIEWVLSSYCELAWRNTVWDHDTEGTYDTSTIPPLVDAFFRENQLEGTEHAWMFLFEGEVRLFGSSANVTVDTLPDDRWASSRDYSRDPIDDTMGWHAELRYFLWFP